MFAYWLCDSQQLIYHFIDRQIPALITLRHASHEFKIRTPSSKQFQVRLNATWGRPQFLGRIELRKANKLSPAPAWWTHKFKTVLRKLAHWQVSRSTPPSHSQHHPPKNRQSPLVCPVSHRQVRIVLLRFFPFLSVYSVVEVSDETILSSGCGVVCWVEYESVVR